MFKLQGMTDKCYEVIDQQEHICFGISPYNSLFSTNYIENLITWGQENFKHISLFVPDDPIIYTLMAMGYSEEKSIKKAKKQNNYLINKVNRALEKTGLEENVHILQNWKKLIANERFQFEYKEATKYFDINEDFRAACFEASKWVLQGKVEEMDDACLKMAVKYFLAEIPMFAASNYILGHKNTVFCYHKPLDFIIDLYGGSFEYCSKNGQAYGIIKTVT